MLAESLLHQTLGNSMLPCCVMLLQQTPKKMEHGDWMKEDFQASGLEDGHAPSSGFYCNSFFCPDSGHENCQGVEK